MAYILFNIDKIKKSLTLLLLSILWLQIQAQNVYTLQLAGFCPPPAGSGSLTGNSCFDIAVSNDNANGCGALSGRTATKSDFTLSAINTQTYTFTPSGTVSNVRFVFVNANGIVITSTSGGNNGNNISAAVMGTVNYNTNLNTLAAGTTATTALTAMVYAVYNINAVNDNNPANDRSVKLTVQVKDCACCGAYSFDSDATNQPTTNPKTWLTFMCHNLGADQSLDPNTYVVGNADGSGGTLGYLYQWGRNSDGHELRNSTFNNSSPTLPASNVFWSGWPGTNVSFWGDGTTNLIRNVPKSAYDPCPAGFKVPSIYQWGSIFSGGVNLNLLAASSATANTWTYISGQGFKVGNSLFLPLAGRRSNLAGTISGVGTTGYYWSSSLTSGGRNLSLVSSGFQNNTFGVKPLGYSVRCVAE